MRTGFCWAAALLVAAAISAASAREPRVGEVAPDATLKLVNGQTVRLSELHGQVVVINFWATWCVQCRQELPLLDTYYRLQKSHGLRVFATTTEGSVPEYKLHALFDHMTIEAVRHLSGPYEPLEGVPTNYIIDRAGIVRYSKAARSASIRSTRCSCRFCASRYRPRRARSPRARCYRQAGLLRHFASAATPGSSRPSIHSRNAPPAVEM